MSENNNTSTTSFSSSSITTTVSETTDRGTATSTITSTQDTDHPTPTTKITQTATPAPFVFAGSNTQPTLAVGEENKTAVTTTSTATGDASSSSSTGDHLEVAPEEESSATFTPVVKLQEIATTTGEEGDDVLWTQRAALYRFDDVAGEWKERGKGDVRFLQNRDTKKIRILLRQEKTLKICMNHIVVPHITLKLNAGSDRSWTWRVKDFANDPVTGDDQTFAIRFKDADSQATATTTTTITSRQ